MSDQEFLEIVDSEKPAVEWLLERLNRVGGAVVAEGRVRRIVFRNDLTRQYGGQYTADKGGQDWYYETDLPADMIVNVKEADVAEEGNNFAVVKQVAKKLADTLDAVVYASMVDHHEVVKETKQKAIEKAKQEKAGKTF